MIRTLAFLIVCSALLAGVVAAPAHAQHDAALIEGVLKTLNNDAKVASTDDKKSYKILFDAFLKLTKPPVPVGPDFNLNTIHPKMSNWTAVSGWAEANAPMAKAILECKDKIILGLPYGRDKVDAAYIQAGITADVGADGVLRNVRFPYLNALDTIAAFTTAEVYRLMESGDFQTGLDLAVAHAFVLRQCCDRDFLAEKLHAIELLSSAMSNMRDVFYIYHDKITAEQFTKVAMKEIPFLRPDRGRLFMPEADRILAEAVIKSVFNEKDGTANPEKFTETFAGIQSKDAPLTRFGAAKRWRMIAAVHGSLDACLGSKDGKTKGRLTIIYDDWWRRWRIDAYDPILGIQTEFDRANPIRYAAVIYSIEDVAALFKIRNRLIVEVNGTAMAAGLCGYSKQLVGYPDLSDKTYSQNALKRSDSDPYDKDLSAFTYKLLDRRQSIDTAAGRLWVESGTPLLWSKGQDLEDQRGATHTDDGANGDIVIWPPIKALQRAQGLLQ